jgi:hypothetical protein
LQNGDVSGDDAKGKGNGVGECTLFAFSVDIVDGMGSKARLFPLCGTNVTLGGMKGEQNGSWDSKGGDMTCSGQEERIFGVEERELRLLLEFDDLRLGVREEPSVFFVGVLRTGRGVYLSTSASRERESIPTRDPLTDSLMAKGERLSLGAVKVLPCPRSSLTAPSTSASFWPRRPGTEFLLGVKR